MSARRFKGEYAQDGKQRRSGVRKDAGHRCIRCGHPFENGKHGKGEWSPCDEKCTHNGPIRVGVFNSAFEPVWDVIEKASKSAGLIVRMASSVQAQWRILTVHHLDGDKANDQWWNTLPLCQRCHLQIQTRLNPEIPYFLEHSDWFKPYAAGFYAWKYEGRQLTREQAESEMTRLLAYECKA